MRRLLKWLLILGVLAGLAMGAAAFARSWWEHRSIPHYQTAKVTRGRVENVVNSTGTVKPVRSVSVGAFVSGPIDKINVDFNSRVHKDEVIATIDQRLLSAAVDRDKAALKTQEADLLRVRALLQQARNNEERAQKLMDANRNYLSDTEMDQYRFNRLSLEAQEKFSEASIAQAKATLKNSEANLEYTKIISPVDGVVIERKVDPGQTVAASFQTPELFIIGPDLEKHVYVFASVDEADIGLISGAQKRNQAVKFTVDAYPDDLFEGRIEQIRMNSTTNQNVVTYPVIIEAKNPDLKLLPGMTANISFQIEARDNALRVPAAALRFVPLPFQVRPEDRHCLETVSTAPTEGGSKLSADEKATLARNRSKRFVWVREGERLLRAVPVTLGLTDRQNAELVSGELTEGQGVVTGTEGAAPPGGRP